ncbi:hypothetical protein E2562_021714, partial [Oryza meyeriana var. granulata]
PSSTISFTSLACENAVAACANGVGCDSGGGGNIQTHIKARAALRAYCSSVVTIQNTTSVEVVTGFHASAYCNGQLRWNLHTRLFCKNRFLGGLTGGIIYGSFAGKSVSNWNPQDYQQVGTPFDIANSARNSCESH